MSAGSASHSLSHQVLSRAIGPCTRQFFHHLLWIGLMLTVAGCSFVQAKEITFLQTAQDHVTQEGVRQQLGPPHATMTSQTGQSLWIYQIWDWQPGNRFTATGAWCDEYILTFDSHTILRRWTHQNHFHGGEAFPKYCVPHGDASPAS